MMAAYSCVVADHQTRVLSCAVISLRTQSSRRREGIGASSVVGRPNYLVLWCRVLAKSKDPCQSFERAVLMDLGAGAIGIWLVVAPVLQAWMATVMAGNALGVMILVGVVGLGAWAMGKTSGETNAGPGSGGSGGAPGAGQQRYKSAGPQPNGYAPPPGTGGHAPPPPQHEHRQDAPPPPPQGEYRSPPPPPPEPQSPPPKPSTAQSGWEKAREETKRKEEERKRTEDLQKKREAAQKMREEAERAAKAKAEKEKWEQARAREKEQREREARERIAKEKLAKEKEAREKDQRERETREKEEKAKADREAAARERVEKLRIARENIRVASATTAKTTPASPASVPSPTKRYERPTAKSAVGTEDAHSYRPYDTHSTPAKSRMNYKASSASSTSGLSESSYAPSMSTARTTPPPSRRGPYKTDDPNKIVLRAVYEFNDSFPGKPVSQLVSNEGSVTDGLVLRIATEGLFIDDDVRGVPQREWDMKAWQLKSVDDGSLKGAGSGGGALHVLRATLRDGVSRKHVFVLEEGEAHKVALGLQRLKAGPLVRSLKVNSFKESEVKGILSGLGWI
jgi:hypothetical protein